VLQLDWDRMIAGHPRQGGIGTKEDVRALKEYMTDLSAAVRQAAAAVARASARATAFRDAR